VRKRRAQTAAFEALTGVGDDEGGRAGGATRHERHDEREPHALAEGHHGDDHDDGDDDNDADDAGDRPSWTARA